MGKTRLACLMPLACARAGFVHVPVNPLLKHAQVAYILTDSGAVLLVGTKALLDTLESGNVPEGCDLVAEGEAEAAMDALTVVDRKSTRLNSSHQCASRMRSFA